MDAQTRQTRQPRRRDAFAKVALWQFLAFVILLCFTWINEIFDLASVFFGAPKSEFNLFRAAVMTAAIIIVGIIAVGHTYEQQRAVVSKLLQTCFYCHRVRNDEGSWEHLDSYVLRQYPIAPSGEVCPECRQMIKDVDGRAAAHRAGEGENTLLSDILAGLEGKAEKEPDGTGRGPESRPGQAPAS